MFFFYIYVYRPDKLKRVGVKGLILFKHVRVRKGRCFSPWRMWIRGGEDDVALEEMTSEVPPRQTMTGSSGRRRGRLVNAPLTPAPLMSPPCTSSRLVLRPFLNWQTNFSEPCPTILYPTVLPHMQPRFSFFFPVGFECQRGNPAWGLFWYCWTISWKTFFARRPRVFWIQSRWLLVLKHLVWSQQQRSVWRAPNVRRFSCFCLDQKRLGPAGHCQHLNYGGQFTPFKIVSNVWRLFKPPSL